MLSSFGCAVILVSVRGCGSSEDDQEHVSVIRKDSMVEEGGRGLSWVVGRKLSCEQRDRRGKEVQPLIWGW